MNNTQLSGALGEPSVLASLRLLVPQREATPTEALRVAEQQAQRLLHRLGIKDGPVPEGLLLDLPRIAIEYVSNLPTSGCSFWDSQRTSWIVQVNASEPITRQRFTLFHEYKHIIDHGRAGFLYGKTADAARRAEQVADFFAGCVLMPRPFVKHAWGNGLQTATTLAAYFDVSTIAAEVRISQIGLASTRDRCAPPTRSRTGERFGHYYRQFSINGQPALLRTEG